MLMSVICKRMPPSAGRRGQPEVLRGRFEDCLGDLVERSPAVLDTHDLDAVGAGVARRRDRGEEAGDVEVAVTADGPILDGVVPERAARGARTVVQLDRC